MALMKMNIIFKMMQFIMIFNLKMYISGINVEKKKGTLKLSSKIKVQPKQKIQQLQQRPYSSENKLLELHNHYSIGPLKKKSIEAARHLSQNKISIKKPSQKNLSSKMIDKTELKKQQKDNYALTLKPKLNKRPVSDVPNLSSARLNPEQITKIGAYFRYLPISILSSLGIKQDFMRTLAQMQEFKTLNPFKKPSTKKQTSEFWIKLNKQAQLKGKYKYRQKYNYVYCPQLKALDYKRKQFKKKKEQSSSSDDDDVFQKCRDMETWKKSMGIDGKVFIIKGKYPDLKQALIERGWVENTDKKSTFYDLKWTTKISDINFAILKPNQMVNHFDNNACLTSKYGLIKSIRSVMYPQNMDIDKFFPKAYDLSDLGDFQNFLQMFKWIFCESILKSYIQKEAQQNIEKVKLSIIVTERRLSQLETILKSLVSSHYPLCSINEWNFLTDKPYNQQQILKTISCINGNDLSHPVSGLLKKLSQLQPQFLLNGYRNIWIVKPAFLSRGRGIKCLDNLNDILDTCLGKETQYVAQKYIENPLIINRRKFDIRIWVVVQQYNPPKIWFYNQFYIRFCLEDYNTDILKNRYAHLTNNSIQKYNNKIGAADLDTSMWDRQTFEKYIVQNYGQDKFKTMIGKMKQIIIATILGTIDQVHARKRSFEQMGYDMMIDQNLNPWLIEVNSSPAMDYSTPITRKLVKMVMEDIAKIIVDLQKKKSKTAGEFKLIYSGIESFKNKYYRMGDMKNQQ